MRLLWDGMQCGGVVWSSELRVGELWGGSLRSSLDHVRSTKMTGAGGGGMMWGIVAFTAVG